MLLLLCVLTPIFSSFFFPNPFVVRITVAVNTLLALSPPFGCFVSNIKILNINVLGGLHVRNLFLKHLSCCLVKPCVVRVIELYVLHQFLHHLSVARSLRKQFDFIWLRTCDMLHEYDLTHTLNAILS